MKVLMLLSNPYLPDARVYREAQSLINRGHEVSIIAWDRREDFPEKETMEGVRVIRTGPKFRGKRHFISDIRKFWNNAYDLSKKLDFEIIHAHDFDTLPLGVKIKKRTGAPLLFDAHETYSEMIRIDVPNFIAHMVQHLENRYLKWVDRMIVVNEHQRSFYSKRFPVDRIDVVMNAKPALKDEKKAKDLRKEMGIGDEIALIYIGALERERFVREMADMAGSLEGVRFIIGGYGAEEDYIRKRVGKKGLRYLGFVHPEEVVLYSAAADLIVSMYREVQTDRIATKFFDAVAAGRGMIVADNGELTAKLVKKYGGGVVCDYSKESFSKAIKSLKREDVERMGKAMRSLRSEYSWEAMEKRLLNAYESLH